MQVVLVVDSIQTMYMNDIGGSAGAPSQVWGGSESVKMCGLGAMYMNDLGGSGGSAGAPSQVGGGDESVTHESVG